MLVFFRNRPNYDMSHDDIHDNLEMRGLISIFSINTQEAHGIALFQSGTSLTK